MSNKGELELECARKQQQTGAFNCAGTSNAKYDIWFDGVTVDGNRQSFGVGGLMLWMLFIVAHLAWESKAGKFGTFVLFLGLTMGLAGFIAKYVIQMSLGIE